MQTNLARKARALVYCPICTHTVEAEAGLAGKKPLVVPGQKMLPVRGGSGCRTSDQVP